MNDLLKNTIGVLKHTMIAPENNMGPGPVNDLGKNTMEVIKATSIGANI